MVDLNNALVSAILTGNTRASPRRPDTSARKYRVDHDISLLVPEIWCRMRVAERDPQFLIDERLLEKVEDFAFEGRKCWPAAWAIASPRRSSIVFWAASSKRPDAVFPEEMLRPEKQDLAMFAAGVDAIVEAQRRVALNYFEDGSVEAACPPLKALLHIMAHGSYEGRELASPQFRGLFEREAVLASDWYAERLRVKQQRDIALCSKHATALMKFRQSATQSGVACDFDIEERMKAAAAQLDRVSSPAYLDELRGTIGADPFRDQIGRAPR